MAGRYVNMVVRFLIYLLKVFFSSSPEKFDSFWSMAMRLRGRRMLGIGGGLVAGLLVRQADGTSLPSRGSLLFCSSALCEQQLERSRKRPVVICGPSGVGKGTLLNRLMKEYPEQFGFSVSHPTREPRPGELDGVHYHFCDKVKNETHSEPERAHTHS